MTAGILVAAADLAAIAAAAEAAYPRECCGLVVGRDRPGGLIEVQRIVASANLADPARPDRFEVDPQVRLAVMRESEGGPDRLVGHYHSHPDQPPEPSATDREMAFEPELIWLIIGVAGGRAGAVRAWRIDGATVTAVPIALAAAGARGDRRFAGQDVPDRL